MLWLVLLAIVLVMWLAVGDEAPLVARGEVPPWTGGAAEPEAGLALGDEAPLVARGEVPPWTGGAAEPEAGLALGDEAPLVARGEVPPWTEGAAEPEAGLVVGDEAPLVARGEVLWSLKACVLLLLVPETVRKIVSVGLVAAVRS